MLNNASIKSQFKKEKIHFESANPFSLSHIIKELNKLDKQEVFGQLTIPLDSIDANKKYPLIIGVAGAGQEISTRPFQLVTGRVWKGTAFGGAKGRRDVPQIVDWYMEGKINIDDLITHTFSLDEINQGFDVMHRGESIRSIVVYD